MPTLGEACAQLRITRKTLTFWLKRLKIEPELATTSTIASNSSAIRSCRPSPRLGPATRPKCAATLYEASATYPQRFQSPTDR